MRTVQKLNSVVLTILPLLMHGMAGVCTVLAQGSLTPSGPPAPMMKSLDQVEPRVPISSAPFTITNPGSYYLTTNLTVNTGNAITISTNNVTLDLSGFTISSTAPVNGSSIGIALSGGLRNIAISGGFIESGVTNDGLGNFSGPGFANGIYYSGNPPSNVRVSGVSVVGCKTRGIFLNTGNATIAESCTVRTVGGNGIYASIIRGCSALDCSAAAINGDQVSDSRGECVSGGSGVSGLTVQNCSGISNTGIGVFGIYNAINCFGSSTSGTGLSAWNASFCTGSRPGGTAVQATIANGCIGLAGTNSIVNKYNMP